MHSPVGPNIALLITKINQFVKSSWKLNKATIPDLWYGIMKGQLKKTLSDASRYILWQKIVKIEDAFLTREINQMSIQEELSAEQEYSSLITPNNKQTYDYEFDMYYSRGNYCNYNHGNTINRQYQQQLKIWIPLSNARQVQQTLREKSMRQKW